MHFRVGPVLYISSDAEIISEDSESLMGSDIIPWLREMQFRVGPVLYISSDAEIISEDSESLMGSDIIPWLREMQFRVGRMHASCSHDEMTLDAGGNSARDACAQNFGFVSIIVVRKEIPHF